MEGTAKGGEDFSEMNQRITFRQHEAICKLKIPIIDDDESRDHDIRFTIHLQEAAGLGGTIALIDPVKNVCEVSIIDDDTPGELRFAGSKYVANEDQKVADKSFLGL